MDSSIAQAVTHDLRLRTPMPDEMAPAYNAEASALRSTRGISFFDAYDRNADPVGNVVNIAPVEAEALLQYL